MAAGLNPADLDPATWARLSPLLDVALELPGEARADWLAGLPPADADLAPMLARLLATPQRKLQPVAVLAADAHAPDEVIGPYRLIEPLGEGGMGEVWLAERADGVPRRQVALKLPHADLPRAGLAARMARERDILAALEHRNIARLYDAGVDEQGRPWLALEYVSGERIDHWCDQRGLSVTQRLRLFLQVTRAVAFAHAQLVVHRDLKPSNLLVDGEGTVHLLDFGIAKLLDDAAPAAHDVTQRGAAVMTPAYASPEQVAGLPARTASDLYSLGVILYELLAGTSPYRPARGTRTALEEAVLSEAPRRPSDACGDPRRRRALRGDLDAIVLQALAKAPGQRYPTVDALVDDIERHLRHEPVRARRAGTGYVLAKFARRHGVIVGAALAVSLALVVGSAVAWWQADRAERERTRAEQVKTFVADMLRDASPYIGGDVTELRATDLMRQAKARLDGAAIDDPAVRVELASLIGEALVSLGDLDRAEPVLAEAAETGRRALGDDAALSLRARLLLAQMHRLRGRTEEQRRELEAMLPILRQHAARDPELLVVGLQHLAMNAVDRGQYGPAESFAGEGYGLAMARLGPDHAEAVSSAIMLALTHRYAQHFDAARDQARTALAMAQALYAGRGLHPRVVEARAVFGRALADTGDLAAGVRELQAAVAEQTRLTGADSMAAAMLHQNLVAYQLDLGRTGEALANAAEAWRVIRDQTQPGSYPQAGTAASYGMALQALGRHDEALPLLAQAAEALERVIGRAHDMTLRVRVAQTASLLALGRIEQAALVDARLESDLEAGAAAEPTKARALNVRAQLLRQSGRADDAVALLASVPPPTPTSAPRLQREHMATRLTRAQALLDAGRRTEAAADFDTVLAESARLEDADTTLRRLARQGLAEARR